MTRQNSNRPAPQRQVIEAAKKIMERAEARTSNGEKPLNLSVTLRGLKAPHGKTVTPSTAETDVNFLKALDPGSAPGSRSRSCAAIPSSTERGITSISVSISEHRA